MRRFIAGSIAGTIGALLIVIVVVLAMDDGENGVTYPADWPPPGQYSFDTAPSTPVSSSESDTAPCAFCRPPCDWDRIEAEHGVDAIASFVIGDPVSDAFLADVEAVRCVSEIAPAIIDSITDP